MTKTKHSRGKKPPIKPQTLIEIPEPVIEQEHPPTVVASAVDPYVAAMARMKAMPSIGVALSFESSQSTMGQILHMTPVELRSILKNPGNRTMLELQMVRMALTTLRDLPNKYEDDEDEYGVVKKDKNGKALRRIAALHKDQLQNEKQRQEVIKYMHERVFGKTKVVIEHHGLPQDNSIHIYQDTVMKAMESLPREVIDVIALTTNKASE